MSTCDDVTVIFINDECLEATITEDALIVTVTEVIDVGGGTYDHTALSNRDSADQHPISSITSLSTVLLSKEDVGTAAALDAAHVAAADPHTAYLLESNADTVISANSSVAANTTHRSSDGKDHSDVELNNTHRVSDGKNHSDVVLNNTHRSSDGKNHSDVVLNNAHRVSDGKNHSDVELNNTHRTSNGTNHANVVLNDAHRMSDGKGHSDVVLNTAHGISDGKSHSDVVLNNAHRASDGKDHSDVVLNTTHRVSDGKNHSDVVLNTAHRTSGGHPVTSITGLIYHNSFNDSDLTAGVLSVNHALDSEFPSAVTVWDNNKRIIEPDEVESVDVNNLTVDLSSFGTITDTWRISIIY